MKITTSIKNVAFKNPTLVLLALGIEIAMVNWNKWMSLHLKVTKIDFSVYDALRVRFGKFVFVIRKKREEVQRNFQ